MIEKIEVLIIKRKFIDALTLIKKEENKTKDEHILIRLGIQEISIYISTYKHKKALAIIEEMLEKYKENLTEYDFLELLYNKGRALSEETKFIESLKIGEDILAKLNQMDNRSNGALRLEAKTRQMLGHVFWSLSKLNKAQEQAEKALELSQIVNYNEITVRSLNTLGLINYHRTDYDQALEYYLEALKFDKEIDERNICLLLNNIGIIYLNEGLIKEALEYFNKGLRISEKQNDLKLMAIVLLNMGISYSNKNEYETALQYFKRSLENSKKSNYKHVTAGNYKSIGDIYGMWKEYDKAVEFYMKSLKIFLELGNDIYISENLLDLLNIYIEKKEGKKAREIYKQLEEVMQRNKSVIINQQYLLAKALLLLYENTFISLAQAMNTFKDMIKNPTWTIFLRIITLLNLLKLYILELKVLNNLDSLQVIESISHQLLALVTSQQSAIIMIEYHILFAKILILKKNLLKAEYFLGQALYLAEESKLEEKVEVIHTEQAQLQCIRELWTNNPEDEENIQHRLELSSIDHSLEVLLNTSTLKHTPNDKTLSKEEQQKLTEITPESYSQELFERKLVNIIAYKFSDVGVEPFAKYGTETLSTTSIVKHGVVSITSLGLGTEYHTGLFGPVPLSNMPDYESLLFSFIISDPTNKDPRMNLQNYSVISLNYHKSLKKTFFQLRDRLETILHHIIQNKNILGDIDNNTLFEIVLELEKKILL